MNSHSGDDPSTESNKVIKPSTETGKPGSKNCKGGETLLSEDAADKDAGEKQTDASNAAAGGSTTKNGGTDTYSDRVRGDVERVPTTSWASEASSDEERKAYKESWWFLANSQDMSTIFIPADLESVYPMGYASIVKAAALHRFSINTNGPRLLEAGLRNKDCYASDTMRANAKFVTLERNEQLSVATLMTLLLLAAVKPTDIVADENRTCVPSSYVLSIVLKEHHGNASIAKAMKHADGGRSTVLERLSGCFSADTTIAGLLLSSLDKIYRSNAKLDVKQSDKRRSVIDLAETRCLTSDEGIIQNHFKVVKKIERVETGSGRNKKMETVTKVGRLVPNLQVGSDLLKETEKIRLRELSLRFNLSEVYSSRLGRGIDLPTKVLVAERLVKEAYQVVEPICSMIKRRKAMIRAQIVNEKGKPVTTVEWSQVSVKVIAESEPLTDEIYKRIEDFCKGVGEGL